jgi:glutamyl-Q tRNA(Asp) synthetase
VKVITRFAPSPTGQLHLGHAYAARVAFEYARQRGGEMLLRFEDIDFTRVRDEYYQQIEDDLHWLGITWASEPWRQSSRGQSYRDALQQLISADVVYPCFCTRKEIVREIAAMVDAPQQGDLLEGPLYPGTCKTISLREREQRMAEGQSYAWRLNAEKARKISGALFFNDLSHGKIPVDHTLLGDVVIARKDIGASYHLAVVCDDAVQQVTHVTRGEDLLAATHVHRMLQSLLQLPQPNYIHHALVIDADGKRLAKRHDAMSLKKMRGDGMAPADIFSLLEVYAKSESAWLD